MDGRRQFLKYVFELWQKRIECHKPAGQQSPNPKPVDQGIKSSPLINHQGQRQHAQPFRVRERSEEHLAKQPVAKATAGVPFNLSAGWLDELVIEDTRWAGAHACHAAQTIIHVLTKEVVEWSFPLRSFLDHVDSSARRIHLVAPEHICWASGQTETAVYTIVYELLFGRMVSIETRRQTPFAVLGARHAVQIFPTNRPGLRMIFGSKRRLISRINSIDPGGDPQESRLPCWFSGI